MKRKKHWLNAIVGLIASFTSETNKSIEVTIYEFSEHFKRRYIGAYELTHHTDAQSIPTGHLFFRLDCLQYFFLSSVYLSTGADIFFSMSQFISTFVE